MKLHEHSLVTHTGNLGEVRKTRQSIDADSMVHLMGMLGNPYSDLLLAVHREYAANALDSHIEAGNTAPIEITLPTNLVPDFVVKDYGVGMSLDELENNFMKYGYSSKRDTDEQVGYFGIGCKCGLNLANQFTIVSVKNGVKVMALMTKDPDGVGVLQVLDTVGTDDPNGVEIRMPIPGDKLSLFVQTGKNFYRFWEPGTVLVDGEAPESVFDGALEIDPDVFLVKGKGLTGHYVVMGNMPYPLPANTEIKNLSNDVHVVARVPIGSIKLTPSRESLDMSSDLSKYAVKSLKNFVKDRMKIHVQQEIDAQPSHLEALRAAVAWRSGSWRLRLTYRDEKIPTSIDCAGQRWAITNYGSRAETLGYISPGDLARKIILVTGHPRRSMNTETKMAIKAKYPLHNYAYVIHRFAPGMKKWTEGLETIAYETLMPKTPKVKAERKPREKKKWEVWDNATKRFLGTTDLPSGRAVYILRSDNYRSLEVQTHRWQSRYERTWTAEDYRKHLGEMLTTHFPEVPLVMISLTDRDRFVKQCPTATSLEVFFESELHAITDQLTPDARHWPGSHALSDQDPDRFLDPKISSLIRRIVAVTTPEVRKLQAQRVALKQAIPRFTGRDDIEDRPEVKSTFQADLKSWGKEYPLLRQCGGYDREVTSISEPMLDYINAMFLYRKTQMKGKS